MIILSKAVESNVASATSTYAAVILKVIKDEINDIFVNIQFYCPTTMAGSPRDALFASNNWLTAPVYPHNGAKAYDFRPGGIIIISYADGNLNSPQFVRWVSISEDIRETNYGYIQGNAIEAEAVLSLYDDNLSLGSNILQKAISLLPYVQKAASSGSDSIHYIDNIDDGVAYRKCGKYGIELLSQNVRFSKLTPKDAGGFSNKYMFTAKNNGLVDLYTGSNKPKISFLDLCKYFFNKITDLNRLTRVLINSRVPKVTDVNFDETTSLYLYSMLAGYTKLDVGAEILNSSVYENKSEESKNKLNKYLSSIIHFYQQDIFIDNEAIRGFCNNFWKQFYVDYNKDLDRAYAIILHNNLFRLKQSWFVDSIAAKALVCCAIIATAYPSLEYYVFHPESVKDIVPNFYNMILAIKQKPNMLYSEAVTASYLPSAKSLAEVFSNLFYTVIIKDYSVSSSFITNMKSNIQNMVQELNKNWDILSVGLNQTLYTSIKYTTKQDTVSLTVGFVWPVPSNSLITSPFGYRQAIVKNGQVISKAKNHNGIDIGAPLGKEIVATKEGTVSTAGWVSGFGNYVAINHPDGSFSEYGHCSVLTVTKGAKVTKGQKIALVGSTGNSTGPHLHFGLKINNNYVNPQDYVKYGN